MTRWLEAGKAEDLVPKILGDMDPSKEVAWPGRSGRNPPFCWGLQEFFFAEGGCVVCACVCLL